MAEPPQQSDVERLVRYCHPAKILAVTRLPHVDALDDSMVASLYGVSLGRYHDTAREIRREAIETAAALREDATIRRLTDSLRLDGPLVALGDSHTDDLASWAAILGALLESRVLNAGLSGDTTTSALARLHRLPPAAHAVVLLGTNDARRHDGGPMLVSHRETRRNLRAIGAMLRSRGASVTWITPPPVDEARIACDPALVAAGVAWRADDVAAKAAIVRGEWPDAVDLWTAFGAEHLTCDGLHPSAAGQRLIAARVIHALSAL